MTPPISPPPVCTATTLEQRLSIDSDADVSVWRGNVAGKPACFALEDAVGRTVLVGTTANLRQALERRLGPASDAAPSRRTDWRAVVRSVRYRLVFSRFEADWIYLENIRAALPQTYTRLIRRWRSYWIAVDRMDQAPRFVVTDRLADDPRLSFGPLPTARAARHYVQLLEDLFDLCRYHPILDQTPHGQACDYKQMGRCPAPCDGTVKMPTYRQQIEQAIAFIRGPRDGWVERTTARMKAAAAGLEFERAARIKAQIEAAGFADSAATRRVAALEAFNYVAVQRGQRKRRSRIFLIAPGRIEFLGETVPRQLDQQVEWAAGQVRQWMNARAEPPKTPATMQRIGLVSWHLLSNKDTSGILLPASQAGQPAALHAAIAAVTRTKADRQVSQPQES